MPATVRSTQGARLVSVQDLGVVALNEAIDKVVGQTATLLTRPQGATYLVLVAEVDDWEMKPGDYVSAFPADPAVTTTGATAGNAIWPLKATKDLVIAAPASITVKGPNVGSVLRYFWN